MIKDNDTISPYQIAMIVIMVLSGAGVFSLPRVLAETAGSNSLIMIFIGGAISVSTIFIIVSLNSRFPGKTLPDYSAEIIGKVPAKILVIIYAVYFVFFIGFEVRVISEIVKLFLLVDTPPEIIMLCMILTCTYAVRGGVECIGRTTELFFPLLFIPFILILLPGLNDVDFSNLLPVFYGFQKKVFKAVPAMALSFAGYETLLYYIGFMKEPKKSFKYASIGVLFITITYVIITGLCISKFGIEWNKKMVWPVLGYVRSINLPGLFIERLDGVMLGIWILAIYTTMIILYFSLTFSMSKIFGTKDQKQYALILVPAIYFVALIPQNPAQTLKMPIYINRHFGNILKILVPLLLLLIAMIRKKGGIKSEN